MFDFIFIGSKMWSAFSGSNQKGRLLAFPKSLDFYSMSVITALLATERYLVQGPAECARWVWLEASCLCHSTRPSGCSASSKPRSAKELIWRVFSTSRGKGLLVFGCMFYMKPIMIMFLMWRQHCYECCFSAQCIYVRGVSSLQSKCSMLSRILLTQDHFTFYFIAICCIGFDMWIK